MAKISLSSDILGMSEIHGRKFLNKIKNRKKKNTNLINKLTKPTLKPFFIREGFGHHGEISKGKTYDKIIHDYMVPTAAPSTHTQIKALSGQLQQKMNQFTQKWGKKVLETVEGECVVDDSRAATDKATCVEEKCTVHTCGESFADKCTTKEKCEASGTCSLRDTCGDDRTTLCTTETLCEGVNGTWTLGQWVKGNWAPTGNDNKFTSLVNKIYTADGEKYLLSENYRQIPVGALDTGNDTHGCEDANNSVTPIADSAGLDGGGTNGLKNLFKNTKFWNESNTISVCKLGKIFKNQENEYFYQDCDGIIYEYDSGANYEASCKTEAEAADVAAAAAGTVSYEKPVDITIWPTWMDCGCTVTNETQSLKDLATNIIEIIDEINKEIANAYVDTVSSAVHASSASTPSTDDIDADAAEVQDSLNKLKLDFEAIQQLFDDKKYTTKSAYYSYIAWTIAALAILSFTIYKINKK